MPQYKCLDEGKVMLGGGIVSTFSDFMTVVLPIPIVMGLQMPFWQRIGVCVMLCLGVVVTIAGSLRTYYTWKSLIASWDETWYAYPLWIAAAVENDVGVICACGPALKSLLKKPIKDLTSKISSKLSSFRSPSVTQNSGAVAKPGVFNPLRSLPWFQINKLDFERTHKGERQRSDSSSEIELQQKSKDDEIQQEAGAQDLRYPEWAHTGSRSSTPRLEIMTRRSFDQTSDYVGGSRQDAPPRSRPYEEGPGEWASDAPR